MLETQVFRDQLDRLTERFPGRETISQKEACELLGVCKDTLRHCKNFPAKKIGNRVVVPIVGLARWMTCDGGGRICV